MIVVSFKNRFVFPRHMLMWLIEGGGLPTVMCLCSLVNKIIAIFIISYSN